MRQGRKGATERMHKETSQSNVCIQRKLGEKTAESMYKETGQSNVSIHRKLRKQQQQKLDATKSHHSNR